MSSMNYGFGSRAWKRSWRRRIARWLILLGLWIVRWLERAAYAVAPWLRP